MVFERLDKPALRALPERRFRIPEWKNNIGVHIDYHIEFAGHCYSVPYTLVGKRVDVRATGATIGCFVRENRIAVHSRSHERGRHTTTPEHPAPAHRDYAEWSPKRLTRWASTVSLETGKVVAAVMCIATRRHSEQGYRSALGIIRLRKRYGQERLVLYVGD